MSIADTFKALGSPVRREILILLRDGRLSAGEIGEHFDMTGATISHHLSQLKKADLVLETKEKNYMAKKSNVYTKTGDTGMTSLVGGKIVPKTHARLEAYGTYDELNSFVGLLITHLPEEDKAFMTDVQAKLFVVGSYLATDTEHCPLRQQSIVTDEMVKEMENAIDETDATLPPLRLFVLPGGTAGASVCHVCRTVCRRAERCVFALIDEGGAVDENVAVYLNRLSDYFFVLARKMVVFNG